MMSRALLMLGAVMLCASSAHARKLTFKKCSATEEANIRAAVKWLVKNYSKVSANMGERGLMAWPGKSKAKLKKKLAEKNLKFKCLGGEGEPSKAHKSCKVKVTKKGTKQKKNGLARTTSALESTILAAKGDDDACGD